MIRFSKSLNFPIFFLITSCSVVNAADQEKYGDAVAEIVGSAGQSLSEHVIVVNDYGVKTQKIKPATEFPEGMRFVDVKITTNGEEKIAKVPVTEIRICPLDGQGNLAVSKAKIVSIQYLDSDGNVLRSDTMQRN